MVHVGWSPHFGRDTSLSPVGESEGMTITPLHCVQIKSKLLTFRTFKRVLNAFFLHSNKLDSHYYWKHKNFHACNIDILSLIEPFDVGKGFMALSVQSRADNLAGSFVESGVANKNTPSPCLPSFLFEVWFVCYLC